MKFACSWKKGESYSDKQQFSYLVNRAGKSDKWTTAVNIGKAVTSKSVSLSLSNYFPYSGKPKITEFKFRVRGVSDKEKWSDWVSQAFSIDVPAKPSLSASPSESNYNQCTFSWSVDTSNTHKVFTDVEYQTKLVENYDYGADANYLTRRFDFQMPVRWMAAGETLDFMVGANGEHNSDATGLKALVTKEDEGRFYDAGLAMANNVTNSSLNPFGTDALGMWYYFNVDTSTARNTGNWGSVSPAEFLAWAPGNLTKKGVQRLLVQYDRNAGTRGFRRSETEGETLPYMCVNHSTTNAAYIAPQEIITHPYTNLIRWTMLRFRPPRSGLYSASIVLRDIQRMNNTDGVMAYLLISEKAVTNRGVSAENWNATAHFTFGPRLVAANEPIDIVISPHNNYYADGTGISAIFRREADVYDAGPSLAALDWANATKPAHPFADALGGGATHLGWRNIHDHALRLQEGVQRERLFRLRSGFRRWPAARHGGD